MIFPIGDENPTRTKPVVTWLLIAANVAVFLMFNLQMHSESQLSNWTFRWGFDVAHPFSIQILTSMFMHGGIAHILGNMWMLWIVGDNVEDKLGKIPYLGLYLVGGVVAALTYDLVAQFTETSPEIMAQLGGRHPPLVGASGAIAAIMGVYLVFFPEARIKLLVWWFLFVQIVPVRAKWFIGMMFGVDLLTSIIAHGPATGGVATMAHVGGGIFGMGVAAVAKPLVGGGGPGDVWDVHTGFAKRPDATAQEWLDVRLPRAPRAAVEDVDEQSLIELEDSIVALVRSGRVRQAIDLYPSYVAMAREKPLPDDVQIEIAHEFYRQWLPKEAIPAYQRYLESHPHGEDAAEAKFRLGVLFARGVVRPGEAAKWLREAVSEHGDPRITAAARQLLGELGA